MTSTTERHIAVMRLMEAIEAPTKTYNACLRKAWRTATDSDENDAAIDKGNAALLEVEAAVRQWVAEHPEAPEAPLCGYERDGYGPCARPAGHPEAYCRDAAQNQYFLRAPEGATA